MRMGGELGWGNVCWRGRNQAERGRRLGLHDSWCWPCQAALTPPPLVAATHAQEYLAPRGEDHPELLEELGEQGMVVLLLFSTSRSFQWSSRVPLCPIEQRGTKQGWPEHVCPSCEVASHLYPINGHPPASAERTVALLVFEDVRASPLADLMDVAQRQKTASELNAAILASQSQVGGEGRAVMTRLEEAQQGADLGGWLLNPRLPSCLPCLRTGVVRC